MTSGNKCVVDGCDKPCKSKNYDWCHMHYTRVYRYGTLELTTHYIPDEIDWEWMLSYSKENKKTGCIEWQKGMSRGYGIINGHDRAHRIAYKLRIGPIPEGLQVCHTCDNPPCINPDHLFLGTFQDNMNDMRNKRRHAYGERMWMAKLTENQVREIKKSNDTHKALGNKYGVHRVTISAIKQSKTWGWVK